MASSNYLKKFLNYFENSAKKENEEDIYIDPENSLKVNPLNRI